MMATSTLVRTGGAAATWKWLASAVGPLVALATVAANEVAGRFGQAVPNPSAFFVCAVVLAAFLSGIGSGLVTAAIAVAYTLYFYSLPGQLFHYSDENWRRVPIWAIVLPAVAVLVGGLKRRLLGQAEESLSRERKLTLALKSSLAERDRAEQTVALAHSRLQAVLDAATQVSIISTELDGTISVFNSGAERMLGWKAEELIGRQTPAVIHLSEEIETRGQELSQQLGRPISGFEVFVEPVQQGQPEEREWTYVRKDGSRLTVNLVVTAKRSAGGEITGFLGIATDVTARKHAERVILQAKLAAESANRAKSEFLANMSHEIRTPLNGILGMTELALDTELSSDQREYLTLAKSSADHLLAVINDILDFSKIEAGRLDLEAIDFDLRNCLDDTLAALATRAHAKSLELAGNVANDVPETLIGDPGRLRQIVVNLIGNAIKFTPRGEVVLRVEPQEQTADQVELHFSVTDSGIGIPADKRKVLFRAFSQVDASTTRKYGGTGLGLAISSQLVGLMGGRIWVESEEGVGSVFHFTARFGISHQPAQAAPSLDASRLAGLSVLAVDDNATNRRILHEMLTRLKMTPTVVDGAAAALEELDAAKASGHSYALVILDSQMPEVDGFMLAAEIGKRFGDGFHTLMMLSSADRRDAATRCRALGVSSYLTKPIKQVDLLAAMLAALPAEAEATPTAAAPRPERQHTEHPLKLLLAEDNPVNQRLAVRLLEQRGHCVIVANNGREALEALADQSFDVVLMDVQMPELDGFDTTAAIRERERTAGGHQPIVAMTAHALKGDRERCQAAGMDGYLAKPLQTKELFEVVERLAAEAGDGKAAAEPVGEGPSTTDADAALIEPLLKQVGGDLDVVRELIELFLAEAPRTLAQLGDALSTGDASGVQRAAHTLKGSLGVFAADSLREQSQRLELQGKSGDLSGAAELFAALEQGVKRLMESLGRFAKK